MNAQNRTHTAEVLYRMALEDLERSSQHDTSLHSALANTLRDWANLLARSPEKVAQANTLLDPSRGDLQEIARALIPAVFADASDPSPPG